LTEDTKTKNLLRTLIKISEEMNKDQYMLMEYLGPVVDGCRAAFNVSLEHARDLHKISEPEMDVLMESISESFFDLTICFRPKDTEDVYSIVIEGGSTKVYDECIEPEVVISADEAVLIDILDSDSQTSPVDILGAKLMIAGNDSSDVIEGLGILCFPSLLRMARSGIDPTSLLSEDADSVIMIAASNLVTKMLRKWIDHQLTVAE
jgi:hypothetical protein